MKSLNDFKISDGQFNLAVGRVFFYGFVFFLIATSLYFPGWSDVPAEFWYPTGLMKFATAPPVSPTVYLAVFEFWKWSLLFCLVGFGYRWIAPLNFAACFFVMNYAHSFGYQTHTYMPVLLIGLPFAFSKASDAISLDRLFFPKLSARALDERLYDWPLKSAQLVFCLVFFAAGYAKLRHGGLEWMTGDTLRNYFARAPITKPDVHPLAHSLNLGVKLYDYPILCRCLAFLTILVELSTPLGLIWRRVAPLTVISVLLLQVGAYFTIFVKFTPYAAIYIAWINWAGVYRFITRTR